MTMSEKTNLNFCLNCNASENDIPLVHLVCKGKSVFICSRCLPVLIHEPQMLIGKLDGAGNISPAQHHD
jgi:hypothetical protein